MESLEPCEISNSNKWELKLRWVRGNEYDNMKFEEKVKVGVLIALKALS